MRNLIFFELETPRSFIETALVTVLFVSVLTTIGCNNSGNTTDAQDHDSSKRVTNDTIHSQQNTQPAAAKLLMNDKLHVLYITSERFIDLTTNKRGKGEKLAFQFCIEDAANGYLTLGAYAPKKGKFKRNPDYFLEVGKERVDLAGKKVRFSTQKLIHDDVDTILKTLQKDPTLKYVAFDPDQDIGDYKIY